MLLNEILHKKNTFTSTLFDERNAQSSRIKRERYELDS